MSNPAALHLLKSTVKFSVEEVQIRVMRNLARKKSGRLIDGHAACVYTYFNVSFIRRLLLVSSDDLVKAPSRSQPDERHTFTLSCLAYEVCT